MLSHVPAAPSPPDAALAAAQVLENAVGLARAEATLVLIHARTALVKSVGATPP